MTNKKPVKEYTLEEGIFKTKCDTTVDLLVRDAIEFATRGFDEVKRAAFAQHIRDYFDMPGDAFYEGEKISRTQARDSSRLMLERPLRTILTMAENKFGINSGKYKQYGGAISKLGDDQLVRYALNAAKTATAQLEELAGEGLTQQMITDMVALAGAFNTAIDKQIEAIRNRENASLDRITKGNELYRELVKVCNTGKDIWYGINEAKYNDYIIYDTPSGKPGDAGSGSGTGILSGTVTDAQTHAPVASANIALAGTAIAAVSDNAGEFNIDNIPAGIYILNVTATGYQPWNMENVEIKDDEQTEVEAKLGK